MKILLAVDPSEHSRAAVKTVISLCPRPDGDIRVLHVMQPITLFPAPQMSPMYAPELETEGKKAKEYVDQVAGELRAAGFRAEGFVAKGDIRERIVNAAAEWPADLIVLASHGTGKLQRLLLGSVAEFVARHAPCSVLIARGPAAHS